MISVQTIQTLLTGVIAGGALGSGSVFAILKKKGVDVTKIIDTAEQDLATVQPIVNLANSIVPGNPVVNVVDIIDKAAVTGAKYAEQLCHANQLTGNDARKDAAKQVVYAALKETNITLTDNQEKLIDATIEAAVNDLGHAPADIKQLQTTINQQNNKVTQLTSENTNLKTTITQFTANAANIIQPVAQVNASTANTV
jgi:hypothetical protein